MRYGSSARETDIEAQLKKCAADAAQRGNGRWGLTLANGRPFAVAALLEEDWLRLEAETAGEVPHDGLWPLLRWNAEIGGGARFVLAGDAAPRLRAEVALDGEVNLAARVREACEGFRQAMALAHGRHRGRPPHAVIRESEPRAEGLGDVRALCEEAGWVAAERGGRLAIELGAGREASLEQRADRGVRLAVELLRHREPPAESRDALALLLLEVSGLARMARAAVSERDGVAVASFDFVFDSAPCAAELGHALSALAVASEMCAREARALLEQEVARRYLAIRRAARSAVAQASSPADSGPGGPPHRTSERPAQ